MLRIRWSIFPSLLLFFSLSLAGLGGSPTSQAQETRELVRPLTIELTRERPVYFKSDDNRREQFFEATLPADNAAYNRLSLHFKLSCPGGFCDRWDRYGSFGIRDEQQRYLELFRFMTPYGLGEEWTQDLSAFLPLLQGKKTFQVFIDTWVGPGHPDGNGWLVSASLHFEGGSPEGRAIRVEPLLSAAELIYGEPGQSPVRSAQLLPLIGAQRAELLTLISGHGQGNAGNCAEFCPKTHYLQVGEKIYSKLIWRDNCASSVNPAQKGTYYLSRAGWCPGDKVEPWVQDITDELLKGSLSFSYAPEAYENSCRPSASLCEGCVFGTGCSYDGGLHTEPRYFVSSYAIYRR